MLGLQQLCSHEPSEPNSPKLEQTGQYYRVELSAPLSIGRGNNLSSKLHLSFLDLDVHAHPLASDEQPHDRDVSVGLARTGRSQGLPTSLCFGCVSTIAR
eukprot:4823364-Amphidinium_carterae.1